MNEHQERITDPFNPESYRNQTIDIVHIQSVQKVAEGRKPADLSDVSTAKMVIKRIALLEQNGITPRYIDDLNKYVPPANFDPSTQEITLGGAFDGQCMAEYETTLAKHGIKVRKDPLLTVRA